MRREELLEAVGARVRALRERRGESRRQLAERSGLSERFLAQLEGGQGNISLVRFADVADALETSPAALLGGASVSGAGTRQVALLGVRGAGKSTIGAAVAAARGVPFIEVDHQIERTAGLSLGEIFELHGEAYYRRLEREVLTRVLAAPGAAVLATGGSIVNHADNYAMLRRQARTVWLRARAEDHWERVIRQGDGRPMGTNPHAFTELRALLDARAALYAEADHVVDTSGRAIDDVVQMVDAVAGPLLSAA
ncbi:shikimate kinase [Haliangium ochraceum]|uniref:shikimate kinase n=1 Tax=Haliangium ochraceum TaxID=80816 RepID=UPI000BB4A8FD|nr:shikimate kinase [Haliangium ochraceum]